MHDLPFAGVSGHLQVGSTMAEVLAANAVQDLLNLGGPAPSAAAPSAADPLAALGFGPAAAAPPAAFPSVTVFQKDGVSITFAFAKPPGAPGQTDITATYTNSGPAPVTGFTLQVGPLHPRHMQPAATATGHKCMHPGPAL
jgi:hypothetical protein